MQRLRGEGPPKLGAGGARGDIHYRFVIDVPDKLSSEQEHAVDELSRTMHEDPRARLFPNGASASAASGAAQDTASAAAGSDG